VVIRSSTAREVDRLLLDLQSDDTIRREAALARLRVLGSRALSRLEAVMHDADAGGRATILRALDGIDDPRVVAIATAALTDDSSDVRVNAVNALRPWVTRETDTQIMETLVSCALDEAQPPDVRAAAREALTQLPPAIVGPILEGAPGEPQSGPAEPAPVDEWLTSNPDAPLSTLHAIVARLAAGERLAEHEAERWSWLVARGAVHAALARRGSAVALYDLRETFGRATAPLPLDYLTAMTTLGDTECLDALARAWSATPPSEVWWRARLADAAAAIVTRLKLTRRHAAFKRVAARWPGFIG
jgi:HEAT repeat protein